MRIHTLLTASAVGALLAGMAVTPSLADPGALPVAKSGHVEAWGTVGLVDATTVPAALADEQIVSISASGNATAAVTDDGQLFVWGKNTVAEVLGVPPLTDAAEVAINTNSGVALRDNGSVVGWGDNGVDVVPDGLTAKAVTTSGAGTSYAVKTDGTLAAWGNGTYPAPPAGMTDLVDVVASTGIALTLTSTGTAQMWGPFVTQPSVAIPAEIQGHISELALGGLSVGAILDDGTVRTWGAGAPTVNPPELAGETVVSLDIAGGTAIAVTADGDVVAWGSSTAIKTIPASVIAGHAAAATMGTSHAAVILTDFRAVAAPTIAGTAKVGQTLTATPADLSLPPDSAATGQWLADGEAITDATGTTLELTEDHLGASITYRTTATRGAETVESESAAVGPVAAATVASTTTLTVGPAAGAYGTVRTATATVASSGATPTGTVTFTLDGKPTTATLAAGKATLALPKTLSVGSHQLSAAYAGDAATEPSSSTASTLTVTKASATLTPLKTKLKGKRGSMVKKAIFSVRVVTPAGVSPAGTVTLKVKVKGSKARTVTVKVAADGTAKAVLKKLKRGAYKATWTYSGSPTVQGGSFKVKAKA